MSASPHSAPGILVCEAGPDLADALARVINAAYVVEQFFLEGDRTSPDAVRRLMTTGTFLAVLEHGDVRACVHVEVRGAHAYFGMLSVDPAHQGRGFARRLIEASEDKARAAGCVAMDIRVVNLRTELPAFYDRLGYLEIGREEQQEYRPILPFHFVIRSKRLDGGR